MSIPTFGKTFISSLQFQNSGVLLTKLEAVSDGLAILSSNSGTVELQGISDPTISSSAASKGYVDGLAAGIQWKAAVIVATDTAGTLASFKSGEIVNGVTLTSGDRILLKDQLDPEENGIYIVTAGTPGRSPDMPPGSEARNVAVYSTGGTVCGGCSFICDSPSLADTVGADPLTFVVLSSPTEYTGGTGIEVAGFLISVNDTVVQTTGDFKIGGVLTHHANVNFISTAAATFDDNKLTVQHTGATGSIINSTGDLIVENTSNTGSIVSKLGTNTNTTKLAVQNSSGGELFVVDGAGQGTIAGNLDVGGGIDITADLPLTMGVGGDLILGHDGTNSALTNSTGNLILDNTNVTGVTVAKLGTNTSTTNFQVQNSSGTGLWTVDGAGAVTSTGAITVVDTTESFTSSTGSLIVMGGVGIAKDVHCDGTVTAVELRGLSDKRKKKDIESVKDTSCLLEQVRVVEYSWRDGPEGRKVGVIAQELALLMPGAVQKGKEYLSVDYNHVMCMLLRSHQSALQRISELESSSSSLS